MPISGATNSKAQSILNREFGNTNYTPPTNWYIGASTTLVNPDGTGATEPTDPSYARVLVNNNTASWGTLLSGVGVRNLIDINFPVASTSWGIIKCGVLYETATGGSPSYYGELINYKTIGIDDLLKFEAGNLQVQLPPTV